jgi:hypothetical protein
MISRSATKKLAVFGIVFGAIAIGIPVALANPTPVNACSKIRQQVADRTLVLDAASTDPNLTADQRAAIDRERAINAAALRRCATVQPTPSAADPTGAGSPTAPAAGPSASSGTKSPTQPAPPPPNGWPGPDNTGVPAGTKLAAYTGPCTITVPNTVIDAKTVNCNLVIRTTGVQITRSKVDGWVNTVEESSFSARIVDSEITGSVGTTNLTILRANIHGGHSTVYCYAKCDVRDSWLHDQTLEPGSAAHLNGVLANDNGAPFQDAAGDTSLTLVHNTIVCNTPPNNSGGGCTGDVDLFGDFGPVRSITVDGNLLGASNGLSYCVYGGSTASKKFDADHIVVTNNVVQRGASGHCGRFGAVTDFDPSRPGNVWSGNRWDTGEPIGHD